MAAQGEHVDAARILLYHKAPVDEVTVDYLTALHVGMYRRFLVLSVNVRECRNQSLLNFMQLLIVATLK